MRLHQDSLAGGAPALVVMCTRPRLTAGKPRAAADNRAQAAYDLTQALVACALEDAETWNGPVVLALAQPADLAWAGTIARRDWSIVGQTSGNIGERVNAIEQLLRKHGARSQVYVWATAPIHSALDHAAARAALDTADVVVGPATDGGVTLMGTRRPWPDLATLAWHSNRLGAELAYLCEREGLKVEKLPRRFRLRDRVVGDIGAEHFGDLARLVGELSSDARPKRQALVAIARRALDARPA